MVREGSIPSGGTIMDFLDIVVVGIIVAAIIAALGYLYSICKTVL